MPGKYAPLEQYLRTVPKNQTELTLSFKHVEKILGISLPPSAYESELWWTKQKEANHVTPRAWSNAGWKVESLSLREKWVRLARLRLKNL